MVAAVEDLEELAEAADRCLGPDIVTGSYPSDSLQLPAPEFLLVQLYEKGYIPIEYMYHVENLRAPRYYRELYCYF